MSPYTFLCAHRLQRKHVRRYKRGVALSCDIPFKALLVRVLERIFSFFLSLSASSRELIQHSDFPRLATQALTPTLVIPRTHAGPGGEVFSTREATHVGPDLRNQD